MIRLKKYINYINECHFGYSIYEYSDYDTICYNTYDGNLKHNYDWHIDVASNVNIDFKYTVIVNMSDDYTGGKFQLNSGGDIMDIDEFKSGAVLMFRSNVQHKVNPVLSGTRKTLSLFVKSETLDTLVKTLRTFPESAIKDAFARGQLHSKKWLVSEVEKIGMHLKHFLANSNLSSRFNISVSFCFAPSKYLTSFAA